MPKHIEIDYWSKGDTLLTFFNKYDIPHKLYFNQSKTDKELCDEIVAGVEYQKYLDENNKLLRVFIPISEEMQLYLFRENDKWNIDIIPILYQEFEQTIAISIENSPYIDILKHTNNKLLANEFMLAFKKSLNFKKMRKGDFIVIRYKQKIRLGKYFGSPNIIYAMAEVRHKPHYIFKLEGRYYDQKGRSLTNYLFKIPLKYTRISSPFTLKRWHPILKKYRAHLGIDYAAPKGTKVRASADGKIIFRGRKGGYGNVIIIRHKDGFKTLYAHLSRFRAGLRVGSWVHQGNYIANVGSTGRSTGPHLHFGLYKNNRAINPSRMIVVAKVKLRGKRKRKFLKYAKKGIEELKYVKAHPTKPVKIDKFQISSLLQ